MKTPPIILVVLELVVALNAVGGGIYGLTGAAGVPVELLRGSPFQSYFWPSLILLVVIGGAMLTAALLVALRPRPGALVSVGAGVLLAGWIGVQVAIIGFVSWLQPTLVAVALVMIGLSVMSLHRRSTDR
jgi:hypothetical protein